MFKLDLNLVPHCTDRQLELLKAWEEFGSQRKAGMALGCDPKNFDTALRSVTKKAALGGYSPSHDMTRTVPEGFIVKGVSTYYNKDGDPSGQWVKSAVTQEAIVDALRDAVEALKQDVPFATPVRAPSHVNADLCNLYTFTDYHLGMLAWHEEGGADWDIKIAEDTLVNVMARMIEQSPDAEAAIINIQGDFLHTDGKTPVTPASKHVLDADSRFPKIRKTAIRVIRHLVAMALAKHSSVHLVIAEGNHDEESAGWLADLFSVHYELDDRITVNDSSLPFYVIQWGQSMIGIHHGHKVKNESLPLLFAAQYANIWGQTTRREIHCGHRHHRDEKEYNGVTVIQHPTLSARDAYAARGGWIADRAAWSITYHKLFGAVGRVMVTPEMCAKSN
jgi:hypothetical protein